MTFYVMNVGGLKNHDFRLKLVDNKDVRYFSPSQGASYAQSANLQTYIYINLPGTFRATDLPANMQVGFSPDEIVLDGQYGAIFTAISNQINIAFGNLTASQRSTILLEIQAALNSEYDNIFQGDDYLDLFRMKLLYNEGFTDMDVNAQPQFNGNISGVQWQTPLDCAVRGYGFGYDELNRLEIAEYGEQVSSGGNWTQNANAFNSLYQYDLNGNFTYLSRNKPNGSGGSEFMDALSYSHYDGNRLLRVSDGASFPETPGIAQFVDGTNSGNDYSYDAMGNLTQDLNKGIGVNYNHFNKPTEVYELILYTGKKIEYIYSADGTKLRQKVVDQNQNIEKVTDYAGMYQYEDPDGAGTEPKALSFIMHPKGRILDDGSGYTYQYFLKDHLGNTRVMFGDLDGDGKINPDPAIAQDVDQVVDYYPFGLAMSASQAPVGTPAQNYTYNGKELQDELGLGWLDYGARMYDASIGRWNGVDALADHEIQIDKSPYAYTWNNPINLTDPDGNCPWCVGALIGAALDYGTQVTVNLIEGKDLGDALTDVDGKSILVSAVAGAAGVGIARSVKNLGTLAKVGTELVADATISATSQVINEGEVDLQKVAIDAGLGQAARKTVGTTAKKKATNTKTGQKLQEEVNRQRNIAKGKSNSVSKGKAEISKAQAKLDNYTVSQGALGAGVAAGSSRKAVSQLSKEEGSEN